MSKIKHIYHKIRWIFMNNEQRIAYMRKKGTVIGEGCDISRNVTFGTEPYLITIGDKVRITSNVQFVTHDGSLWVLRNMGLTGKDADKFGRIIIGNNVNIGWNTVIMPGVTIGDNCIIGINAVVTKDIPAGSVAVGVPARVIESVDEYYKKNKQQFVPTKGLDSEKKKIYLLQKYHS